jgi:hypothetical protein
VKQTEALNGRKKIAQGKRYKKELPWVNEIKLTSPVGATEKEA